MDTQPFFDYLKIQAEKAKDWILREGNVRLLTHNDSDGVCSSAIMISALKELDVTFHVSSVKQLKHSVIKEIAKEKNNLIIFTDFGSGQLENIEFELLGNTKVIILDHHELKKKVESENLIHINPHLFGIDGGVEISGAGVSYLFAENLLNRKLENLGYLAVLGAISDNQETEYGFISLNKQILENEILYKRLVKTNDLKIYGRKSREIHKALEYCTYPYIPGVSGNQAGAIQFLADIGIDIKNGSKFKTLSDLNEEEKEKLVTAIVLKRMGNSDAPSDILGSVYEIPGLESNISDLNEFSTVLNACSKMGSYPTAVSLCLNTENSLKTARDVVVIYKKEILNALKFYESKEAVKETDKCIYLIAGNNISDSIINTVSSIVAKSHATNKIIIGLANAGEDIKVSARNSDLCQEINLKNLMSSVATKLGGEGGGHKNAAGAFIPIGKEQEFIKMFEESLNGSGKES